jgi:hypothetical protein
MGRAFSTHGGEEDCIQGFGGMKEGKAPSGSPRFMWGDNIIKWILDK